MKKNFNYHDLLGEHNPLLRYKDLLDAALDEFSSKKFEEASLNDIIKQANFSKGSLYHHFGDKFGLYLAMMDIIINKKITFFTESLQDKQYSGDFFNTLRSIIKGAMDFMYEDERLHYLFNRNLDNNDDIKNQLVTYFPYDYTKSFNNLIITAIESGQISNRFSPDFIASILEILFSNVHKLLLKEKDADEVVLVIDQLLDFMQYGISNKS